VAKEGAVVSVREVLLLTVIFVPACCLFHTDWRCLIGRLILQSRCTSSSRLFSSPDS
jgi:hypothetical protein